MNDLPWQAVAALFFIVGAVAMFGILTWFYFNVKDELDGVSDGADGDTESVAWGDDPGELQLGMSDIPKDVKPLYAGTQTPDNIDTRQTWPGVAKYYADTEPSVRAQNDKTPDSGGNTSEG